MPLISSRHVLGALIVLVMALVAAAIGVAALTELSQSLVLSLDSGALSASFVIALVPFAAWSFGLRVIRWHTLARRLAPGLPLRVSGYTHLVGFAFSATPGRIAELYKLKLLERSVNVPVAQSLPAALAERLTDLLAFGLLAAVGGLLNLPLGMSLDRSGPTNGGHLIVWLAVGAGLLALALAHALARRHRLIARVEARLAGSARARLVRWSRRLPGVGRLRLVGAELLAGGTRIANPFTLGLALACVVVGRVGDGVVLWQIARAVGYPMPFSMALLMIGSAGLVGGITLSPGGLGAVEVTLTGLIVAHGAPLGIAMLTAFGARALIFWLWVALGLLIFLVSQGRSLVPRLAASTDRPVELTVRYADRPCQRDPSEERS